MDDDDAAATLWQKHPLQVEEQTEIIVIGAAPSRSAGCTSAIAARWRRYAVINAEADASSCRHWPRNHRYPSDLG